MNSRVSKLQNKIKFSIFHLNIRSLNKNYREVYTLLCSLDVHFDVIVLSEIWSVNLNLFANIFPGYSFYYDAPTSGNVGGVGVYVKSCYTCNVINELKVENSDSNKVENIWIEISDNSYKCIIGAFYRHPNSDIQDFSTLFEHSLSTISKNNIPCFIAGDFNIDLGKYKTHTATTDYVNMLLTNNFLPNIVMPTRITDCSATIIDHVYYYEGIYSKKNFQVNSGNIWSDITDHLPNFMLLVTSNDSINIRTINRPLIRLLSPKNINKFCSSVRAINWEDVLAQDSVEGSYAAFETKINHCYNSSFPLVHLSRKRYKDKNG